MNVVLVEPSFPANQRKHVAGLAGVGATVIGIGETPEDQLDGDLRLSRRYAAGMVALRPDHDGRIQGYSGLDEMWGRLGDCVIDTHLPGPGTPTQPVEAAYMANAWVRLRHPDYDQARELLDFVGRTVHVYGG